MMRLRALLAGLSAVALVAACTVASPPVQEMSDARLAIAAAEDVDAGKHAPDAFTEAQRLLQSAESNLERRAYSAARRDAALAKRRATEAREKAERESGAPSRDPAVPMK